MTSPTAPARARRLGHYGPFAALAIAVAAWSAGWLWLKSEVERRLDGAATDQQHAGGAFTWSHRRIYGFPFRIDVDFTDLTWRAPDGWGVAAPSLKTETFVFAPQHWVVMAPAGAALLRPAGRVDVAAKVLRASLSDMTGHPPSFSLEGLGLAFTPVAGSAPYFVQSAAELHVHTRAGPADLAAFYVELDGATPTPDSPLGRVSAGKPVTLVADAIYSHARALAGTTRAAAIAAWAGAGGQLNMRQFRLQAGDSSLDGHGTNLSVDGDGRLEGDLNATLTRAADALTALAQAGVVDPAAAHTLGAVLSRARAGAADHVTLGFAAGRTTLGPVAVGPSPKVY